MNLQLMIYISLLVFLGLIVGGALGGVINNIIKQVNKLLVFSGSIVLGLIIFEIIPESTISYDWLGLLISILLGLVFMHQIHLLTETFHQYSGTKAFSLGATFLVIAIAIHNLPAGIAISSNWINESITNEFIISFIIHQIPEGLALFLALVSTSSTLYSLMPFISFSFIIVLSFFFALLLGEHPLFQDPRLSGIFMGISIGSLSYVSIFELIIKPYSKLKLSHFIQFLSFGILTVLMFTQFFHAH